MSGAHEETEEEGGKEGTMQCSRETRASLHQPGATTSRRNASKDMYR
jgi:hypothetical protein